MLRLVTFLLILFITIHKQIIKQVLEFLLYIGQIRFTSTEDKPEGGRPMIKDDGREKDNPKGSAVHPFFHLARHQMTDSLHDNLGGVSFNAREVRRSRPSNSPSPGLARYTDPDGNAP